MIRFPEPMRIGGYRIIGFDSERAKRLGETVRSREGGIILNNGYGPVTMDFVKNGAARYGEQAFTEEQEEKIHDFVVSEVTDMEGPNANSILNINEDAEERMIWDEGDVEIIKTPPKKKKTENWDEEAVERALKELEDGQV